MATNQEQMSQMVNYHKRIAMGAALDGTSMGSKETVARPAPATKRPAGALAQARKK